MKTIRNISKAHYFIRESTAWFLVCCMLFGLPLQVAVAIENPAADALPSGLIDSVGVNAPVVMGTNMGITQTASEAIMNWTNFDIGSDAAVEFIQPSSLAAVLNRVHDGDVTGIMGSLTANGRVFVVNPAGVIFGSSASVNVAQLVASSLDILDEDFINGIYNFNIPGVGEVINDGIINADEGVALLGQRVANTGTIATTNPGGFVVMAAGDRVLLGEPGSSIVVEMSSATGSIDGVGEVINSDTGTISSPEGTVVLAAGDIFSAALSDDGRAAKVTLGSGTVQQSGTINASAATGDGGTVSLTSGDKTVLGSTSQTTANAGTNGDGGQVVVYSPGSAIFEDGARVEAKGGSQSGNGGFFELSGKEYVEVLGDIDLTAANGKSGMFLIDPLNLTIVDSDEPEPEDGGFTGPDGEWQPGGTGSQLDIDILEGYLGLADVTLSTLGTEGPEDGDIIFDAERYVHTEVGVDNSLFVRAADDILFTANDGIWFEGNGHVELYAGPEGSVTTTDRGNNVSNPNIWTRKGDIIIEAGRGGIDVGVLRTGTPSTSGLERPGEIRLQTIKEDEGVAADGEYDITTEHLRVEGKGYGSVYVNSDGNLTINGSQSAGGAVHVKTNAVADNEDALSFICLTAEKNVTINSTGDKGILAQAHGNRDSIASIWIGAGTNVRDPEDGYSGTVTINGDLHAKASAPGSAFAKSKASIQVFGSDILITTDGGIQEPHAEGVGVDVQTSTISTTPFIDEDSAVYDADGELIQGSLALVWIDETQDGTCLNCGNVQRKILPVAIPDWLEESKNIMVYAIVVLVNDKESGSAPEGSLIDGTVLLADNPTTKGTLTLINGDTEVQYEPPTDWVFDENGEFTDYFEYFAVDSNGDVSEEPALVTIVLINQDPVAYDNNYGESHNVALVVNEADGTIKGTLNGVLEDYDPDNDIPDAVLIDTLTVDPIVAGATANGGTVDLAADGSFTYKPSADNTTGTDSFEYTLLDGFGGTDTATVTINLSNEKPVAYDNSYSESHNVALVVNEADGTIKGTLNGALEDYDPDNSNVGMLFEDILTVEPIVDGMTTNGGTVNLSADGSFTYKPSADNKTGTDSFEYTLQDGFGGTNTAIVTISLTNLTPVANPDFYNVNQDTALIAPVDQGTVIGLLPAYADYDPDNENPDKLFNDELTAFLDDGGTTTMGGSVTLNPDGSFTYEPPDGWAGTDTFEYYVTDGYDNSNTVQVTITVQGTPTPTLLPVAPLPVLEQPEIGGCPVLMDAVASELGVTSETIQVSIGLAITLNPGIQPCDACASLVDAIAILRDTEGTRMAAMTQVFDTLAPAGAPFTPEMAAAIATAFADNLDNPDMPQYAAAMEYVDAFVEYVTVIDTELGSPVDDSVALVMERYGAPLTESDNPNIGAYVAALLEAAGM